ncbi:MAG: RHS repeat-associated core domain-containing protein [Verrucomicrobiales bacterium]
MSQLPYVTSFEKDDGFAVGSLDGQGGWTVDQGTASIGRNSGRDRSQGLVIAPSEPFGQVSLHLVAVPDAAGANGSEESISQAEVVFSDFYVQPVANDGDDRQFADVEGSITGFFKIDGEGELQVLDGNGNGTGEWRSTGVTLGTRGETGISQDWLRLTIRQDFGQKVWDIYADDKLVGANLGFWNDDIAGLERFSLMGHSQFPLRFDDIQIAAENMLFPDADSDGLPDAMGARDADADKDGLTTLEELIAGTDPDAEDTDHDGLHDADELKAGRDPLTLDFFTGTPSDDDFRLSWVLNHPFGKYQVTSQAQRIAAAQALTAFGQYVQKQGAIKSDTSILEEFVDSHPDSPFVPYVLAGMARFDYRASRFTRATQRYEAFFAKFEDAVADASDRSGWDALSESAALDLVELYARHGRQSDVDSLLAKWISDDPDSQQAKPGAQQQRWLNAGIALDRMKSDPSQAYACGARALHLLRKNLALSDEHDDRIIYARTGADGMSLADIEDLAQSAGMRYRAARRVAGAIPVPSILHWKGGHFATVVSHENDDTYIIRDPVDELARRVSAEVLDEETSGFFLVPEDAPSESIAAIDRAEAEKIKGKSWYYWLLSLLDDPCPEGCGGGSKMMATYAIDMFRAGYVIKDTPIWIDKPYGHDMELTVTWSRNAQQRPNWTEATHLEDPKWATGVSLVYEDGPSAGDVEIFLPDGRKETHLSNGTGGFIRNYMGGAQLQKISSSHYVRTSSDDSKLVYKKLVTGSGSNRIYLSELVDPDGNKTYIGYSSGGKISTIYDYLGNSLNFNYYGSTGRLTSVYDSANSSRAATFVYAGSTLDYITDPEGIKSDFGYSGSNVLSLGTPYGTTYFSFTQDSSGQKTEILDPEYLTEKVHYRTDWSAYTLAGVDSSSNAVSTERPAGSYWATADANKGVTLHWDKKAMKHYPSTHYYHHYAASQYAWALKEYGSTELVGVPSSTRPPADGAYRTYYQYEGTPAYPRVAGNSSRPAQIAQVVRDEGNTYATRQTSYTYNSVGNLTQVTHPGGVRKTKLTYFGGGIDLQQVEQYDTSISGNWRKLASFTYHSGTHRVHQATGADGQVRTYAYNSKGQVSTITDPTGVTRFLYDSTPQSGTTYDGYGYLMEVQRKPPSTPDTSYVAVVKNTAFDSYYRPTTTVDADGYVVQREFDKLDRITKITYPGPGTNYEQFFYNSGTTMFADLRSHRDREGKFTYYTYTGNRQLETVNDPENSADTVYEWCACGDLESITDPKAQKTTWHRDLSGRVTQKDEPGGYKYSYTYYPESGQLKTVRYPKDFSSTNITATYTYYKDGNLHKIDHADSNTPDVTYTYETYYDRVYQRFDGAGTWTNTYHTYQTAGGGQLHQAIGPFSYDTVKHTYDIMGRLDRTEVGEGSSYKKWMDASRDYLGRVTSLATGLGTFNYEFQTDQTTANTSPVVKHITYPNSQNSYFDYALNSGGRFLTKIRNLDNVGGKISEHTYTNHTSSGQIGKWQRDASLPGSTSYDRTFDMTQAYSGGSNGYDNIYRVRKVVETGTTPINTYDYTYDAAGNRLTRDSVSYTANSQNQLLGYGLSYDGNGNTLTQNDPLSSRKFAYEWDAIGRLTAIVVDENGNGSNDSADSRTEYSYDGLDRRYKMIEKTGTGGSGWSTGITSYFIWDGVELSQKRIGGSSSGYTKNNYYSGMGETRFPGTVHYYYTTDHLGSVREVTNSSRTVVGAYDYSPYGMRTNIYGSFAADFGYTGHQYHKASGLHLALYRAYDAQLGRWLSPDPIGEAGGLNLYGYVGGDPINLLDVLGLNPGDPFDCPDQAAADALDYLKNEGSDKIERGGHIYKDKDGKYRATEPAAGGKPGSRTIDYDKVNKPPNGTPPVADYHTHPYGTTGFFSPQDKMRGYSKQRPQYVRGYGIEDRGPRKFTPGEKIDANRHDREDPRVTVLPKDPKAVKCPKK